jgi:hypothetical protein
LYVAIAEAGGMDAVEFEVVESFPCHSRDELLAREREWIDTVGLANLPGNNINPWVSEAERNLQERRAKRKHYSLHRAKVLQKRKAYVSAHQQEQLAYAREYGKRKVTCECGSVISNYSLKDHRRTKLHSTKMDAAAADPCTSVGDVEQMVGQLSIDPVTCPECVVV